MMKIKVDSSLSL